MTAASAYESLLLEYKPCPIRGETAYRRALKQIDRLMKCRRTRAEEDVLELLSSLVVQYESQAHPVPAVSPAEMLAHLMEARGATAADVGRETGIVRPQIAEILAGKREVSKMQASKLGAYFHVCRARF